MKSAHLRPGILLFRGRGPVSALIRWQTRSQYSHAALLLQDGSVIEAWQGGGVRRKWLRDWVGVDILSVPGMTDEQWHQAIAFARAQIGLRYDWRGVFRFVSRRRAPGDDRWFCSELVYAACRSAGVDLLRDTDPAEVSPGMLARSPLLTPTPPL